MALFDISTMATTITEGQDYSFTLIPRFASTHDVDVRWEVILHGRLAAREADFTALSGSVSFDAGVSTAQDITIGLENDTRRGDDRSFAIRLFEVAGGSETQIGEDHDVTLIEDDTSESLRDTTLGVTGSHDKLVIGSSYAYRDISAGGGDDTFIITRHLTQDITISDPSGKNTIKFGHDTEITHFTIDSFIIPGVITIINSITLTLGTGANVFIPAPSDGAYLFQLGDGEVLDYADFVAEITKGGFVKDGSDNDTTELLTPVKIDIDREETVGADSQIFTIGTMADTVTEGQDYSFTLTPRSVLSDAVEVRWEIILHGRLAAREADFTALSGSVSFDAGVSTAQDITIGLENDTRRGDDRSFAIRLFEVAGGSETQIGEDHDVTLIEDDTSESLRDTTLGVTGSHDKLVIGSSYAYRDISAGGGDDTFIITRHLTQDITISDPSGKNTIKFGHDTEITHFTIDSFIIPGVITIINSITLTLGTGANVFIPAPSDGAYLFQLGDGEVLDYADFVAEITKDGFVKDGSDNDTTELLTPVKIDIEREETDPDPIDPPDPVDPPSPPAFTPISADHFIRYVAGTSEIGAGEYRFASGTDGLVNTADDIRQTDAVPNLTGNNNIYVFHDDLPDQADDITKIIDMAGGNDTYFIANGFSGRGFEIRDSFGDNTLLLGEKINLVSAVKNTASGNLDVASYTLTFDTDNTNQVDDTAVITIHNPDLYHVDSLIDDFTALSLEAYANTVIA